MKQILSLVYARMIETRESYLMRYTTHTLNKVCNEKKIKIKLKLCFFWIFLGFYSYLLGCETFSQKVLELVFYKTNQKYLIINFLRKSTTAWKYFYHLKLFGVHSKHCQ